MRRNYVVGFAFSEDRSKVVLMRKNRPAWQAGKLNGIGGKFEDGEDGVTAMCREFHEETGIMTSPDQWHNYTRIIGQDGDVYVYRMFDDIALNAQTTSDEEVMVVPVDYDMLRREALSNLTWLIAIALDESQPIFYVEANYNQDFRSGESQPFKTGTSPHGPQ